MPHTILPGTLKDVVGSASLQEALQAALSHFECAAGTWHTLENDTLILAAACRIPPPVLSVIQSVPIGKGIAGLAAQRKEPVSLCNLQTDESGQARPGAKATGMEGSLAVPALSPTGELKGVLGIAKPTAHDWTDGEKKAVLAVAALFASR
jgi:putative methionine-R-sulfoxide reductase with GAF domain